MTPGFIPFRTPDSDTAANDARAFCKSRGLTQDDARIIRREINGEMMICVEIKRKCVLKLMCKGTA
jgi:hypothetical protein